MKRDLLNVLCAMLIVSPSILVLNGSECILPNLVGNILLRVTFSCNQVHQGRQAMFAKYLSFLFKDRKLPM